MLQVYSYIKKHWYEALITFCLFSNLYPYTFPSWLYYIGIALIGWKFMRSHVKYQAKYSLYVWFIVVVLLSTVINFALDLRLVLFTAIILFTAPVFSSPEWHTFKKGLLKMIFIGFAITVVLSEYAYYRGINYQVIYNMGGVGFEDIENDEFSGFAKFPMWNSAAAAMGAIFFAFLYFRRNYAKKWMRWFYLLMFGVSIHVTLLSASRSATAASMLACALLLLWTSPNIRRSIRNVSLVVVLGALLYPFFYHSATRMMQKQEVQNTTGKTSRDALWEQRKEEFLSSPIIGVGFSVHGTGYNAQIGRNESGSSWFSALAQTGIIGFSIMLILWLRAWTPARRLKHDFWNLLFLAAYVFFTFHSIVEGYMLQGGWYMCVICWLVAGVLTEEKSSKSNKKINLTSHLNN